MKVHQAYRDRFIHEEVMGKCWHEKKRENWGDGFGGIIYEVQCVCGFSIRKEYIEEHFNNCNPTYLEHNEHWGELLNHAMKQEWWDDFIDFLWSRSVYAHTDFAKQYGIPIQVIADPAALATNIKEYSEAKDA